MGARQLKIAPAGCVENASKFAPGLYVLAVITPMPFSYVVYKEHRLVISTGLGCLTWSEIKEQQDQTKADLGFDPEFNQLVDLRAVTRFEMTSEQTRMLARRKIFSSTSKRAFLASDATAFGMSRMWEILTELSENPSQIRVFQDLSSALKWLGLEALPDKTSTKAI